LNLWNLFNRFDGDIGTNMRKAAHPSGGMASSKSMPLEGRAAPPWWWCLSVVCAVLFVPSRLVVVTRRM
jgi:hypothetical protein